MPDTRLYQGAVMFTDMKDFTFRTTVLDRQNLDMLIESQSNLVLPSVKKYSGKIVKTIGDSYMVVFHDTKNAVSCAIDIQKRAEKYNQGKKILQKIEFRIAISSGELSETKGIQGNDYFGTTVNMVSRLLIQTRANKILVTSAVVSEIGDDVLSAHLGDIMFKGMLEEEPIYQILYEDKDIVDYNAGNLKQDAFRKEIEEKIKNTPKEIEDVIFKVSSVTAIVSIQPIPFLDIYSSVPLHMYMVKSIGDKYGLNLRIQDVKEILGTISVGIGASYALGQGLLGLSKIGLPIVGGYLAVPFSFGFTYALGKTISTYFYYRSQNTLITRADMTDIFVQNNKTAIEKAKKEKKHIMEVGNKQKDQVLGKIQVFKKHS